MIAMLLPMPVILVDVELSFTQQALGCLLPVLVQTYVGNVLEPSVRALLTLRRSLLLLPLTKNCFAVVWQVSEPVGALSVGGFGLVVRRAAVRAIFAIHACS
jgi:hypothetical protein